ncbi:MAG: LysR family transcriptional regulator [Halothiobacillaceae bacterium]|nr:LysR family transcriptional regulator [Halothiobacillaceae bacterium]HQS02001.1 LysR family transcriptional regulator [Halothiobacillus sp.]HQS28579.1 LysR family transcriptional regulator [Halothiobacillus sp.]
MDDLRTWRWLILVMDTGGLQAAADQVHRTPSTLSHAIKQLELKVGLPLVAYQGRRLILTDVGRLLTQRIRPVLRDLDGAQALVAQLVRGVEPLLAVAIDQIIPMAVIAPALLILAQKYPQTRVELYETVLGGGPSLLHSGAVGLYLGTQPVAGLPARRLDRLHLVPSAAKTHPLVLIDGVTEADLRAHRQIVIRDSAPSRMANGSWLSAEQRFTVDHLHTALGLIEAGMGFAWLPQTLVQSHPGLAMLTLAEPMTDEAPIHLVSQAAFAAGAAGAVLIEAITAQFAVNKAGSAPQNK